MVKDKEIVEYLKFLIRSYDGIVKLSTSIKNRYQALNPEGLPELDWLFQQQESQKNRMSRRIEKELELWPVWSEWMKNVPGIGPSIGGRQIIMYYYKFVPVCQYCGGVLRHPNDNGNTGGYVCEDCGKKAKRQGLLKYKIEIRDFPKISNWWSFLGLGVDPETGKKVRPRKGVQAAWSPEGRANTYQIGEQFIKAGNGNPYRKFYDERREKREKTHPEATKAHRHAMARHETGKLFQSHFWQVAREIEGLPITKPYIHTVGGHEGFLEPFFWNGK